MRGAVGWAAAAPQRRLVAEHPKWRLEHLSWPVPGGRGPAGAWSVAEGEPYARGAVVAQVRTPDDLVFDLTAPSGGTLLAPLARVGEIVGPTLLVRSKRPASCLDGDPPEKRQELTAAGEWLLTPDGRLLVECAAGARHVRLWSIPDGAVVGGFQPTFDDSPQQGRVFVNPDGRSPAGGLEPGRRVLGLGRALRRSGWSTFREANHPQAVMVNEEAVAAHGRGRGRRLGRAVPAVGGDGVGPHHRAAPGEDRRRRGAGPATGTAAPSTGSARRRSARTASCTRCRCAPRPAPAVALQASRSDQEVFRAEHPSSLRVRMAFTADGRFLLTNWDSDQRSQVDVWEL